MAPDPSAIAPVAAAALALAAGVPYVLATARGAIRPNRATWIVYAVVGAAGCAGMIASRAEWTSLALPAVYAVIASTVCILAIRHGTGGWSRLDRACLGTAGLSLVLWPMFDQPLIAVVLPALADLAGTIPTIVKAWRDPGSEHRGAWCLFMSASLIAVIGIAIDTPDLRNLCYPVCILIGTVAVVAGLLRPGQGQ